MRRRRFVSSTALGLGFATFGLGACTTVVPQDGAVVAPLPDGVLRRIAFGSCIDQARPQAIWDAVIADKPDLFIFGGDNVYASQAPWSAARLSQAYQQQARVPGFERLRQTVPHMAIWDDHDYGANDGGAEFPHKEASKEAFLRFWNAPAGDARRTRDGIYHAKVFGTPGRRVQVILLDTRWFRSPLKITDDRGKPGKERYLPDADPGKTMLGEAQWLWLEAQLRTLAEIRLVVSSIQVLAEGHGWERWGNLPRERERLYRLVSDTQAGGVVFLSGDRHIGALYRESAGSRYPLYEITSSGITHPWASAAEAGPNRLGDLVSERHYGSVDIDWDARSLRLSLKDERGGVLRSQLIPFNALRVPS